jgi:membrane associated rhomboid family serine protease
MFSLPPVTRNLIVACTVVYFLQSSTRLPIDAYFALWPPGELFQPWQLVTYAFLHGGFTHLLFNMFGLWMFGADPSSAS